MSTTICKDAQPSQWYSERDGEERREATHLAVRLRLVDLDETLGREAEQVVERLRRRPRVRVADWHDVGEEELLAELLLAAGVREELERLGLAQTRLDDGGRRAPGDGRVRRRRAREAAFCGRRKRGRVKEGPRRRWRRRAGPCAPSSPTSSPSCSPRSPPIEPARPGDCRSDGVRLRRAMLSRERASDRCRRGREQEGRTHPPGTSSIETRLAPAALEGPAMRVGPANRRREGQDEAQGGERRGWARTHRRRRS